LQAGLKVKCYIYVDVDEAARQVAKRHSRRLRIQFLELLATSAIKTSFSTLAGDIALVSAEDIYRCSYVDLVIAGWPYQGYLWQASRMACRMGVHHDFMI
jgi:site-specific DNA-cytosine methylase